MTPPLFWQRPKMSRSCYRRQTAFTLSSAGREEIKLWPLCHKPVTTCEWLLPNRFGDGKLAVTHCDFLSHWERIEVRVLLAKTSAKFVGRGDLRSVTASALRGNRAKLRRQPPIAAGVSLAPTIFRNWPRRRACSASLKTGSKRRSVGGIGNFSQDRHPPYFLLSGKLHDGVSRKILTKPTCTPGASS